MPGGRAKCCSQRDPCEDVENVEILCPPSIKEFLCNRIKNVRESTKVLENVMDISATLVKILQTCGIHECKANKALDVIIYAFMHFDEVAEHPGGKCKKRIRKDEFLNDLMRECCMTKAEAKLTYSVVKCAFKAFYHKQVVNQYDVDFIDECEWKNAANKTVNAFIEAGANQSEIELTGRRILCAYQNYITRNKLKKCLEQQAQKCDCCPGQQNKPTCPRPCPSPCPTPICPLCCQPPPPPKCPPEPPLCGQLCGEIICPVGSPCPQIVCKDPCGNVYLRIEGDVIQFDPQTLATEARKQGMCPPCKPNPCNPCNLCSPCKPPPCYDPCDPCKPGPCCDPCREDLSDKFNPCKKSRSKKRPCKRNSSKSDKCKPSTCNICKGFVEDPLMSDPCKFLCCKPK